MNKCIVCKITIEPSGKNTWFIMCELPGGLKPCIGFINYENCTYKIIIGNYKNTSYDFIGALQIAFDYMEAGDNYEIY